MSDYLMSYRGVDVQRANAQEDFECTHDVPAEPGDPGVQLLLDWYMLKVAPTDADAALLLAKLRDAPADAPETETAEPTPVVFDWETDESGRTAFLVACGMFFHVRQNDYGPGESYWITAVPMYAPFGTRGQGVVKVTSEEAAVQFVTFWRDTLAAMAPPF